MNTADIHLACKSGNLELIVKAYVDNPGKINEKDSQLSWTPLYRTVISGRFEAAEFLLSKGADPNIINNLGETPLHQAADSGNYELAELLISYKVQVNVQQNEGDTALHHSAFRGDCKMLGLLLQSGGNPNIKNKVAGRTPLHYAVDCGYLDCVLAMLKYEADPHIVDSSGKNAFNMTTDDEIISALKNEKSGRQDFRDDRLYIEKATENNDEEEDLSRILARNSFSSDKLNKIIKSAKINTTSGSQKSTKPSKFELFPIYSWLEQYNLSVYYEIVLSSGYSTIESLTKDLENGLSKILPLIKKPGHRDKMAFRVKESLSCKPRQSIYHRKSKSSFLKCCGLSGNNTQAIFHFPSLKNWLEHLNMEVYYDNFFSAGWDDYETMVLMSYTEHGLSMQKMINDLKITNQKHAQKILRELDADNLSLFSRNSIQRITFDDPKSVACESCLIY